MIDQQAERKNAAEFWLMRRTLMLIGIWLIACALMSFITRFVPLHNPKNTVAYMILGCMMLALGVWMIKAPSPSAFLALCFIFVLGDVWAVFAPDARWGSAWPIVVIWSIIVTILACLFFYRRYQRCARFKDMQPPRALVVEMGNLIKRTMRGEPGEGAEYAQLKVSHNHIWKIGCFTGEMLMVGDFGWDLCYERRDEVCLRDLGKVLIGTDRKIVLEMGRRKWKGRIDAAQYERLENWTRVAGAQN